MSCIINIRGYNRSLFIPCAKFMDKKDVRTLFKLSKLVCDNVYMSCIKKNSTRCNNVSKFYYSIFIWSSTCFGRHTVHHQEPKTALAASGFSYVKGCWMCRGGRCQEQCAWQRPPTTRPTTFHVWKTRGYQCSFRLLMMGGMSPETCWASYKYRIIKFWYIVASC